MFLLDHDLGYLTNEVKKVFPYDHLMEKLEEFDMNDEKNVKNSFKLIKAKHIYVFLKFSPRVKEKSIRILQELIKLNSNYLYFFTNIFRDIYYKMCPGL